MGLGALGCGVVIARYIFARIEQRTVRISDPKASARLPSHVDTERLLFLVFATEWVLLAMFVHPRRGVAGRRMVLACVHAGSLR